MVRPLPLRCSHLFVFCSFQPKDNLLHLTSLAWCIRWHLWIIHYCVNTWKVKWGKHPREKGITGWLPISNFIWFILKQLKAQCFCLKRNFFYAGPDSRLFTLIISRIPRHYWSPAALNPGFMTAHGSFLGWVFLCL